MRDLLYDLNFLQCAQAGIDKKQAVDNLMNLDVNGSLSHGEKQILSILKSMTKQNKIMIFDEPTASIDYKTTEKLVEVMNGSNCLNEGATVIMIAHQLKTLSNCDRIFKMIKGGVICEVVGEEFQKIVRYGRDNQQIK